MKLGELLRHIAPAIAGVVGTAVGGPLGPAAALAVKMLSEKLLGKPDATEAEVEQAISALPPAEFVKLRELDLKFKAEAEERGIKLIEKTADLAGEQEKGVTERWVADVASDSWLSKNIRPICLLYILIVYTVFASASAFGVAVTEAYVKLLGEWGMLVMSAYFGSRAVEKVVALVQSRHEARETKG